MPDLPPTKESGIVTDSAGNRARYTPIESLEPGDAIMEGWKPWLVVREVEQSGDEFRAHFEGGHVGAWVPRGYRVPAEVRPE